MNLVPFPYLAQERQMIVFRKRGGYVLAALVCTLMVVGCRKGTLTGNVSYKGKPVTSGTVTAYDEDGTAHQGTISEEGNYSIDGIPKGTIRLTVTSPDPNAGQAIPKDADKERVAKMREHKANQDQGTPVKGWRKLPAKYSELSTSDLTFEVKGGTNTYDIPLADSP